MGEQNNSNLTIYKTTNNSEQKIFSNCLELSKAFKRFTKSFLSNTAHS